MLDFPSGLPNASSGEHQEWVAVNRHQSCSRVKLPNALVIGGEGGGLAMGIVALWARKILSEGLVGR